MFLTKIKIDSKFIILVQGNNPIFMDTSMD